MSGDQIIAKGKEVLNIEGKAVINLVEKLDDQFVKTVNSILNTQGRVVLTGMGKSGLIARKIVATLNSTGTASIFMHPTDALHGDLGMVREGDIVIVISKSGNTEELHSLMPMFKRLNVIVIGMLGNKKAQIADKCDFVLDISVEEEACPHDLAPTASTTVTLALGDAIAVTLLEMRGFTPEDFAMLHPGGSLGKRLSLKISEIMYKGESVPKVMADANIRDVIIEITTKMLGTTTVVDENGILQGIITDGDLRRLLEKTMQIEHLQAKDIMTKNPKTISQEYLASFALQQMEKFHITSLVAIDEKNSPVGMIHLHDLVKLGLQTR